MVRSQKVAPTASYAADGELRRPHRLRVQRSGDDHRWPVAGRRGAEGPRLRRRPYPAGSTGGSTNIGIGVAALLKTTPAEDQAGSGLHQVPGLAGRGRLPGLTIGRPAFQPGPDRPAGAQASGVGPVVQRLRQQLEVRATPSPQPAVVHRFVVPLHRDQRRHRREDHASPGTLHRRQGGRPGARPERLVLGSLEQQGAARGGHTTCARLPSTREGTVGPAGGQGPRSRACAATAHAALFVHCPGGRAHGPLLVGAAGDRHPPQLLWRRHQYLPDQAQFCRAPELQRRALVGRDAGARSNGYLHHRVHRAGHGLRPGHSAVAQHEAARVSTACVPPSSSPSSCRWWPRRSSGPTCSRRSSGS